MPQGHRSVDKLLYASIDLALTNIETQTEVRAPIYILSKNRAETISTHKLLDQDNLPYRIVVEPQDLKAYADRFTPDQLLPLDKNDQGVVYVRNYIKDNAYSMGDLYCWMLDDDMLGYEYRVNGKRHTTTPRPLMSIVEQSCFQFGNIGGANLSSAAYLFGHDGKPPVVYNSQIYGVQLLRTDTTARFRPNVAEDTDYSLQLLHDDWVTLVFKRFGFTTVTSGTNKGGLTDGEYTEDGRLERFRQLQRYWPGAFKIGRLKDGRPHLVGRNYYSRFRQVPRPINSPRWKL